MKTVNFDLAQLKYDEKLNVLFFRVKQDIEVDVKEIGEMLRYVEEFMGPKRHLCVVDFGTHVSSSSEARKLYADSPYIQNYRIADAFLVKSLALSLVANFFIQITKPKVKTRMFSDENQAVEWLLKMAEQETGFTATK